MCDNKLKMTLHDALIEVQALKAVWKANRFDEYFLLARAFLQKWREPIRTVAHDTEPALQTIRCLEALLVIHDHIATADQDTRDADEDLFLDTAPRYRPSTPDPQLKHDFEVHTRTSNISKRRAFVATRRKRLDWASSFFEQAAASAERAMSFAGSAQGLEGAARHLQYLRFHRAATAMRWAESQGLCDDAEAWWREAKIAAEHSKSPPDLFVGRGYLLGREDLDAYIHLIAALRAFLKGGFAAAAEEYEAWLSAVPKYRMHWRFQNVVTRKRLAEVLACLDRRCPRCITCSAAVSQLEAVVNRWGIGRSARELARLGLALRQLGSQFEPIQLQRIINSSICPLLPLGGSTTESTEPAVDDYFGQLPNYFVASYTEIRRLRSLGSSETLVRDFIWRRLREFVEICAEYEQGRAAILFSRPRSDTTSFSSLASVVDCIIDARNTRKAPTNFGTRSWQRTRDQITAAETDRQLDTALAAYELTTKLMAAYFPAIVRVVARDHRQREHITRVEQLGGDELEIRSQFPLDGNVGYLPPRYGRQPLTEALRHNDRSKWIPATKAAAVFLFQTTPVWEGDWSHFKNEFESQYLDFKQEKPQSLAKHLAAFANAEGGWLVFGVYDPQIRALDVTIRGLDLTECTAILDAVSQAGLGGVSPIIGSTSFFRAYPEGKLVMLCRIDRSPMRPHRVDGRIYLRIGAASKPITDEEWQERGLGAV